MDNGVTIKEYIKDHHDQLSAMGVLAGLAAFVGGLTVSWIGYLLSFLMLSCLVLIWSEMEMRSNERSSLKLSFFKLFLNCAFWLIVLYILLSHRAISWFFLFVPLFLFFIVTSVNIIRRFKTLMSFFEKHRLAWVLVFTALLVAAFLIGSYLSTPVNSILDKVAQFNIK